MKIVEFDRKIALYEGLGPETLAEALLWEDLGHALIEANLTPDQIDQLFTQVQSAATAAGINRTAVGKAVDIGKAAASKLAVHTQKAMSAFNKLKDDIANTDEMRNFDAKYAKVARRLRSMVGGQDSPIMQAIYAYRDQAKKHPILQSAAYAVAIGALGLSGAGLPGAAVLGLIKLGDRLLQGDKATSAVWQGLKTAGITTALGAAKEYFKGASVPTAGTGTRNYADAASQAASELPSARRGFKILQDMVKSGEITDYNSYQRALSKAAQHMGAKGELLGMYTKGIEQMASQQIANAAGGRWSGNGPEFVKKFIELNGGTPSEDLDNHIRHVRDISKQMRGNDFEESTNQQMLNTFILIEYTLKDLGKKYASAAKAGVGAAIKKATDKGAEYTQNITATKLAKAWKAAGSPTDSNLIHKLLLDAGVPADVIRSAFNQQGVPEPEAVVVKTSNSTLDDEVNEILRKQGKAAAIKHLQDLKAAAAQSSAKTAKGSDVMKASDGSTYKLSIGKAGDRIWLNTNTGAEASHAIDQELEKATAGKGS